MNEIVVIFYSNFYPKSKEIKEYFEDQENIRYLCVDNKDIRDKILKDKIYGIKSVPTLLFLKQDGSMQIYEKEGAIQYYDQLREKEQNEQEMEKNKIAFFASKNQQEPEQQQPTEDVLPSKNMSVMEMAKAMESSRS